MPNSSSTSAAGRIVGQSESEPMTTPTRHSDELDPTAVMRRIYANPGRRCGPLRARSLRDGAAEPAGRMTSALAYVVEVVAVCSDMSDLAAGPNRLAVKMRLQPRVAGLHVRVAVEERRHRAAEDVVHHRPGLP